MNAKKLNRLKKKAYRDAYVGAQIDQGLAYQIKAIRESRGWDQKELARRIGLRSQSAVARMEDPSYGKLSISSLKKLGRAFDVGLLVKFVPFSRILTETEDLSPDALSVRSFEEEVQDLELFTAQVETYKIVGGVNSGPLSAATTIRAAANIAGSVSSSSVQSAKPVFAPIPA